MYQAHPPSLPIPTADQSTITFDPFARPQISYVDAPLSSCVLRNLRTSTTPARFLDSFCPNAVERRELGSESI